MITDPNSLQPTSAASEHPLELDMNHLRERALAHLIPGMILVAWAAFIDAVRAQQRSDWAAVTAVLLIAGAIMASIERTRAPRKASIWLIAAMVGALFAFVFTYPDGPSRYLAPLVLMTASTLFTGWGYGVLVAGLALGLSVLQLVLPDSIPLSAFIYSELVLLGSAVLLLLSRAHLFTALAWSGQSTERAMALTEALRRRQLQLNRSLRAMEEATSRIERMNNELALVQREAHLGRQSKSRFAATVSHEIRGPLNLILGFGRLLALSPDRYGHDLTSDYYTDVDAIYRNAEHLATLVDDVLDMSRIEADQLALIKSCIDLERDVVLEAVATVKPLAVGKGLEMRVELGGNLPLLVADPVRLRQAMLNLLLNAVRLTEKGGITVTTALEDGQQLVTVADTGPGIPPERVKDLFQEFTQIGSPSQAGKSTGLGLSITKSLIEAHNGRIWVASTSSQGAAITFGLPSGELATVDRGFSTPREMDYRMTQRSLCLVFHPDPPTINMLARYVEGYRVVGLADPAQLVRTIDELRPKAIITSTELLPQVELALEACPYDVPLIHCALPRATGQYDLRHILGYLTKPIQAAPLASLIRRVEPRAEPLHILIVDDEPDATRLVESMVVHAFPESLVVKTYDGLSALELMRKQAPDVVLIDWFMPRLNGQDTILRMRQEPPLREIPVIIITGHDLMEGGVYLGTPICGRSAKPIEIMQGAKCLKAMIDAMSPDYLTEAANPERPLSEPPG